MTKNTTSEAGAPPGDIEYMLRGLQVTPLRFRAPANRNGALSEPERLAVEFVRERPGASMDDIWTTVWPLHEWEYARARSLVAGLVDKGALAVAGQLSLEQVDKRYERVAACDLCGADSAGHPVVLWKHNTPVVRCTRCGLLYSNPRWKAEHLFGRYTSDYWDEYAGRVMQESPNPDIRWMHFITHLDIARQTNRVLDVGCATGEFLLAAKARGWEVYGVEPSPAAAQVAAERAGAQVHTGTLETATFPDGWFDAVTLWDVIEHVQSPSAYLSLVARLVRPGGIVSITTPNIRSLAYRLLGRRWTVVGPNDHIYYFAPVTMSRLLAKTGFKVHTMTTWKAKPEVWRQWLRYPALAPLAGPLSSLTKPVVERFLFGDDLYAIGRRLQ